MKKRLFIPLILILSLCFGSSCFASANPNPNPNLTIPEYNDSAFPDIPSSDDGSYFIKGYGKTYWFSDAYIGFWSSDLPSSVRYYLVPAVADNKGRGCSLMFTSPDPDVTFTFTRRDVNVNDLSQVRTSSTYVSFDPSFQLDNGLYYVFYSYNINSLVTAIFNVSVSTLFNTYTDIISVPSIDGHYLMNWDSKFERFVSFTNELVAWLNDSDFFGDIEEPDEPIDVGFLQNVQQNIDVYSVTAPSNAQALLERYVKFGWDSKTSTDYVLKQGDKIHFDVVGDVYSRPSFGTPQLLRSNVTVSYIDVNLPTTANNSIIIPFAGLNFDADDNIYSVYEAFYSAYDDRNINIYNPRFILTPYARDSKGNFIKGGSTRVTFDKALDTFFTGRVPVESSNGTLEPDGNFSSSSNQAGAGSGTGVASSGDNLPEAIDNQNSVIQGILNSSPTVDASNLTENLTSLISSVQGIPSIFASLFSWLPSWCLVLMAVSISSLFVIALIKRLVS